MTPLLKKWLLFLNSEGGTIYLGIVEHTRHGIPSIVKRYGRGAFTIQENHITVTIPFEKGVLEERKEPQNRYEEDKKERRLTDKEVKIIMALLSGEDLTLDELSEETQIAKRTVSRGLDSLKEKGYLQRVGSTRSGYWKILK